MLQLCFAFVEPREAKLALLVDRSWKAAATGFFLSDAYGRWLAQCLLRLANAAKDPTYSGVKEWPRPQLVAFVTEAVVHGPCWWCYRWYALEWAARAADPPRRELLCLLWSDAPARLAKYAAKRARGRTRSAVARFADVAAAAFSQAPAHRMFAGWLEDLSANALTEATGEGDLVLYYMVAVAARSRLDGRTPGPDQSVSYRLGDLLLLDASERHDPRDVGWLRDSAKVLCTETPPPSSRRRRLQLNVWAAHPNAMWQPAGSSSPDPRYHPGLDVVRLAGFSLIR